MRFTNTDPEEDDKLDETQYCVEARSVEATKRGRKLPWVTDTFSQRGKWRVRSGMQKKYIMRRGQQDKQVSREFLPASDTTGPFRSQDGPNSTTKTQRGMSASCCIYSWRLCHLKSPGSSWRGWGKKLFDVSMAKTVSGVIDLIELRVIRARYFFPLIPKEVL